MGVVNISTITREAEKVEAILQTLPFDTLESKLSKLGINVKPVTYKDTIREIQRKGGNSRPYPTSGNIGAASEIGKLVERSLIVLPCYNEIYESILSYRNKGIILPQGDKVDNQTKKHPLERIILENVVKTIAEDIADGMFHGTRDETDLSPMGMLDGFFTQIATEIASGAIKAANGNYAVSGAIAAPLNSTDTIAIDRTIAWVRKAHPALLKNPILMVTPWAMYNMMEALNRKLTYKPIDGYTALQDHLRAACLSPTLRIISDPCLGTGSQMILTEAGNMDLGMNTQTDAAFIQVRAIERNPNIVQFYSQWELGTRINSIHGKKFFVNEQTNIATDMSGDYRAS